MKRWVAKQVLAIEDAAAHELDQVPGWMWNRDVLPIPVETIVDSHFGLLVRDEIELARMAGLDRGAHVSGLLFPRTREILVDAEEGQQWPGRRRFTIAHELGHWVRDCNRGLSGLETIRCRTEVLDEEMVTGDDGEDKPQRPSYPPATEYNANRFAAALLMPRRLVQIEHAHLDGDERRLADMFGVSVAAMKWRIHFLHQIAEHKLD